MNANDQKIAGLSITEHLDAIRELLRNCSTRPDDDEGREMRFGICERIGSICYWAKRLIEEAK